MNERMHSTSNRPGEAMMRWVKIWHVVFYVSLIIPSLVVLAVGTMRSSPGLVLGLSLFEGVWYALMMIWLLPKTDGRRQTVVAGVYLLIAVAAWVPLGRASWAYFLTAASFFGLMWGTLPFGWAVAGNIALIGLLFWTQRLNIGRPAALSGEMLIIGFFTIGWVILLALWIRSVMRESAERKRLIDQLEATRSSLASAERQAGIFQERQRLAQEIHDTLAQGFTSIVMQLEAADLILPADQVGVRSRLLQARETARSSLAEARRLVQALRPESLEGASLPDAMGRVAERWQKESGTPLEFSVTGSPVALPAEVEVSLLRLMQEGLANIQKHARARQAAVTLSYMEDVVALDIHDDGVGFDPESLVPASDPRQGGFGLQTMRERVTRLGGVMVVESSPGQGATLAFQIPLEG